MKPLAHLASLTVACLALAPRPAAAQAAVWYDAARQAIAIDAYVEGPRTYPDCYRPSIDVDFDGDHLAGATVGRSLWAATTGVTTEPGLYQSRVETGTTGWTSITTWYGWGERLGDLAPRADYRSAVTSVASFPTVPAPNRFVYFTDLWDVAAGRTVIYVQPLDDANAPIPVVESSFAEVSYRVGGSPWTAIAVAGGPDEPPPPPPPPTVEASVRVMPQTLNLRSKGQSVTVRLVLPAGHSADQVDVDSLRLRLQTDERDPAGLPLRSVRHGSGPLAVVFDDGLVVKFSRADLQGLAVAPGETALTLTGKFQDGTRLEAHGAIRVVE